MKFIVPSYYKNFKCIASACRHSCCVGWEIDIDAETYSYYGTIGGEIGESLKSNIAVEDGQPHFILDENERCPFLNKEGLYKTVLINVYNRISLWESSLAGDIDDPVKVIRDLVHSYFEFLTKNQSFVRILLWENLNGAIVLKDSGQSDLKAVVLQLINRVIADGKARGVFRADADEYQVTMSLLNFAFSYFANVHTLSYVLSSDLLDEAKINERAAFISDILIKYLTA